MKGGKGRGDRKKGSKVSLKYQEDSMVPWKTICHRQIPIKTVNFAQQRCWGKMRDTLEKNWSMGRCLAGKESGQGFEKIGVCAS